MAEAVDQQSVAQRSSAPPMMHIGELAERTGLSLRTIRHYDDVELLKPSGRSVGGFRLYTDADQVRLLLIRRMKPLGFTLEEMADLLAVIERAEAGRSEPADEQRLADLVVETERRRQKLRDQVEMAEEFLGRLQQHRLAAATPED